jgi:hypothetical protein
VVHRGVHRGFSVSLCTFKKGTTSLIGQQIDFIVDWWMLEIHKNNFVLFFGTMGSNFALCFLMFLADEVTV